ncbi:helix-turn-helix domain-containing protein [Dysgonomonas sp. Marseille-P4361]|uniref:helix-turn-helix domain-containing protein n=1 Tax=Dysgonomonas sp. Marseille-P4361 TaxID=2161820 RepID=UPI000D557718|nr:helix-turn-helix transcriptional regulator [Dysgonomonas sp. Marseille-P4361]
MNYRIKDLCKEKGITIGDLSDKVGIARESISRIIGGNNTSTDTLQRIASALNVPITDLFEQPQQNIITCPNCGTELEVKKKL